MSTHSRGILQNSPLFAHRQRQNRVHNWDSYSNLKSGSCPWYKTDMVSYLPTLTLCQASVLNGLYCVNSSNLSSNPQREQSISPLHRWDHWDLRNQCSDHTLSACLLCCLSRIKVKPPTNVKKKTMRGKEVVAERDTFARVSALALFPASMSPRSSLFQLCISHSKQFWIWWITWLSVSIAKCLWYLCLAPNCSLIQIPQPSAGWERERETDSLSV